MSLRRPERTGTLKFIDHWAGTPICIILGLLNRLTHPFYSVSSRIQLKKDPGKILVIKFFGLGSILLSSSLLKSIKARYPDSKITFLTFKNNAALVKRLKISDEVRTIDPGSLLALIFSAFSNLLYFSFNRPDVSIDLEFFSKFSTIMSYLSGARSRLGFYVAGFWRNSLVNIPIHFNYARHILEIYGMFAAALDASVADMIPAPIVLLEKEGLFIDNLLSERGISREDFLLGVNVNASDLAYCRKWPIERFAYVINSLLRKNQDLKVILTGLLSEKEYTASIYKYLEEDIKGRVFDMSGDLDLGQFLTLLGQLHIFLTNDSGPFHLAKAQGAATISVWGPGSPDLYGPYGRECERHKVVYKRYSCSPCLYIYRTDAGYFCKGAAPCLDVITVEDVKKVIQESMDEFMKERRR